ncbi:MAG: TIM-barrel domain-containing protein [Mariniphaga sp.]
MKKNKLIKIGKILIITILVLLFILYFYVAYPLWGLFFNAQRHTNPPLTPAWALECWIWDNDFNTAARVDTLLVGYKKYDIPVRTINLDSPWCMRFNDYQIDTARYPNPKEWFAKRKSEGYRIVMWTTTMVNSLNKDTPVRNSEDWFNKAKSKGYLTGNGQQNPWWKGKGGFIDYSNPEAMKWWRGMQQLVFDYGIDGWKLDDTATLSYYMAGPIPFLYRSTFSGLMSLRTYMDHFYRDEYHYGLTKNPEFITLGRSIDQNFHPEGFAPLDAAPVTWVGDQKHIWKTKETLVDDGNKKKDLIVTGIGGFEMAIQNILAAAKLRYNVIGSDVAGFSGSVIPSRLYIRWAQFSAFCGLFLNGGHGERALWRRTPKELEVIRKFSWLHTELVPYMYSYVVTGHEGGRVLQKPVDGKYHYLFGDDFLVAPLYQDTLNLKVTLPKGKWRYFFNDREVFEGGTSFEKSFPLEEFPVFIREGAIVPLNIQRSYTGLGTKNNTGKDTWLIYPGMDNAFTLYHPDKSGTTTVSMRNLPDQLEISVKDAKKPSVYTIRMDKRPSKVLFGEVELSDSTDYHFDNQKHRLTVEIGQIRDGVIKLIN